ncbi:MAG: ATP-dependent helicase [Treponema sp.]|jgi:DNA helicase-2/ATP-dependent DNA helicase PcrA|nr:ATP-dependent helicase [Treponema sp.]
MTKPLPYLELLNPEQREAVLHQGLPGVPGGGPRPLLILAGAGSGKTRVITTKIAYLIREQGMDPRSIMAVTFTNKAAREMAARAQLIDPRAAEAMMRTFHSFGAWFLRRNAALAGIDSSFVIYDDDDALSLLGTVLEDLPRAELREIAVQISRAKDYFLSPEDPDLDLIDHRPTFRRAYALYEERLKKTGNLDFGDLIKKPVETLRSNPGLADRFRNRFRVIMVDEYQDSNVAQERLLRELTGPETYLCVVGDDDQSIYRFRGAEVRNILEFPERFPGTDIIRLERNYRSFAPILALASSVVDHNQGRLGKTLRSERGRGKLPILAFLPDQDEEAAFCAELIERSVGAAQAAEAPETRPVSAGNPGAGKKPRYSDWAILYRTNAQSLGFETELLRRGIPYRVVGSLKFYEREEIKDSLALLALLLNPRDEVAFRRIVNKPARGIGGVTLDRIIEAAYAAPGGADPSGNPAASGLLGTARTLSLSVRAQAGIETFSFTMERAFGLLHPAKTGPEGAEKVKPAGKAAAFPGHGSIRSGEGLSVCAAALIRDSGLAEYHTTHDEINGYQRRDNLQELVNAASLYPATVEGLAEFMEHIELDRSAAEDREAPNPNSVTLITLHNTKGLEFPRVILTGLEQGVFPRDDKEAEDLEEERRLFYVGATRAMDELYLCSCAFRRMYGRTSPMPPSRFLQEADPSALRVIGGAPSGFRGSAGNRRSGSRPAAGKVSSDGRWKTGERIFQDDHGYGAVVDIAEGEDGPVVKVHFDNGQETRFLSRCQSGRFTKIGNDG